MANYLDFAEINEAFKKAYANMSSIFNIDAGTYALWEGAIYDRRPDPTKHQIWAERIKQEALLRNYHPPEADRAVGVDWETK